MTRRLLFLHRHEPSGQARESLDAALVSAVFEQRVSILFREAGVLQMIESDRTDAEWLELLRSLPDYGVDAIYVCAPSLQAHGVDVADLLLPARALSFEAQGELLRDQDMVLTD